MANDPRFPYLDKEDPGVGGLPDIFDNWLTVLLAAVGEAIEAGETVDPLLKEQVKEARAAQKRALTVQFELQEIETEVEELEAAAPEQKAPDGLNADPNKVRAEAMARLRNRQEALIETAQTLIETIPQANVWTALEVAEDANPYSLSTGVSALSSEALDRVQAAAEDMQAKFDTWRNDPNRPLANLEEAATRAVTREGTEGYGELVAEGASTPFGGSETLRRDRTPTTDDNRISGILDDLAEQLSVAREQAVTRLAELDPLGGEFGEDGTRLYAALERLGDDLGYSVGELLTADAITAPRLEEGGGEGDVRSYQGIKGYLSVAFDADFPHYQDATGDFTFRHEVDALLDEFIAADIGFVPDVGSFRDHDGGEAQKRALERIKNQDIIDAIDLSINEIDTANASSHELLQTHDRSAFTYTEKVFLAEGINDRFGSDSPYQGIISDRTSEKIVDVRERAEPELKRIGIESPEAILLGARNKITTVAPNWKGAGHPTARAATRSAAATGDVPDPGQRSAAPTAAAPTTAPVWDAGESLISGSRVTQTPAVPAPRGSQGPVADMGDGSGSGSGPGFRQTSAAHPMTGASGTAPAVEATEFASEEDWFNALRDQGHSIPDAAKAVYGVGTPTTPPGPGGPPRMSAAEIQAANKDAVYDLLAEEFGGFSFFLKRNDASLMVGLTADGSIVAADDANAATVKSVLDVIVDKGLTDFNRIQGVLKNTQWWQDTDAQARDFDIRYGDMSDPEQLEYLEPIMDVLYDQADYLGFELTAERARENAELLARAGDGADEDAIREMMGGEQAFSAMSSEVSEFAARRKEIQSLSAQYYVPISDADAADYAEQEYLGVLSAVEIQNMFKEQAIGSFGPAIESAINAGFTTQQYFAPYKHEIEKMLDRPNINLYEEFGDVIEYMPDTGGEVSRPMTLGETRKYVRGLDEWQTSSQGQDSARSLAFAIGKTFGEVA